MSSFLDGYSRACDVSIETDRFIISRLDLANSSRDRELYASFYFEEGEEFDFVRYSESPERADEILRYMRIYGFSHFSHSHIKRFGDWQNENKREVFFVGIDKEQRIPVLNFSLYQDYLGNYRISYYCSVEARGVGYASEGYRALSMALEEIGISIHFAEIPVENKESVNFLLRQGFRVVACVNPAITNGGEFLNIDNFCLWRDSVDVLENDCSL